VIEFQTGTTLDALARCRQLVLTRTNDVLTAVPSRTERRDGETVEALTGLLMTTLEELKVAEEELREQNMMLGELRQSGDQRAMYYRHLFMHIPAPSLVTDMHATILESNQATEQLLRRDRDHLERKPLAALLHPSSRQDFRTYLSRLVASEECRRLTLTFNRHGDTPIDAEATVAIVPNIGPTRAAALFWLFTVESGCE
jgi:PAS domain S-box-containing protein